MLHNYILLLPFFVCLFWALTLLGNGKRNVCPQNRWIVCTLLIAANALIWGLRFGNEENSGYTHTAEIPEVFFTGIQVTGLAAYIFIYLIYRKCRLYKLNTYTKHKYINTRYLILSGIFLSALISFIAEAGNHLSFVHNPVIISLLLIMWTGIFYYLGYDIYHIEYKVELSDHKSNVAPINKNENEMDISQKSHYKLLPRFNQIIDEEKIFLQNNLHIEKVAWMLKTNRTYISRLINQEYQCSFSDFINQKRIEFAQELIYSHPELTQEQIAEKVGFTHASSFSRAFKQQVGQTFREWYKNNQKNIPPFGEE